MKKYKQTFISYKYIFDIFMQAWQLRKFETNTAFDNSNINKTIINLYICAITNDA